MRFTEKERHIIKTRLNMQPVTSTPDRRRLDALYELLRLDDIPDDQGLKLSNAGATWAPWPIDVELTKEQRDSLIDWLAPAQAVPQTGFLARLTGAVLDKLVAERDAKKTKKEASAASA